MTEVVVLGDGTVSVEADVPRERDFGLEVLLARRPRAAIVAGEGEPCFFRASLAFERGVSRVVIRPGSIPEAWVEELAARADELGSELWIRGDRYLRAKAARPPRRIEVGAPSSFDFALPPSYPPLPLAERREVRCEEVAFAIGLKPVLYLVVPSSRVEALRAEHHDIVTIEDRLVTAPSSGERTYGVGEAVTHVFVGKEARRAAELWPHDVVELGGLMGYPPCCVRAFAAQASRRVNAAFPYVTAARTRAFGDRFDASLDTSRTRLVPFVPCSYGCPRAIAWARAVAHASGVVIEARPVLHLDETRALVFETCDGERYGGARFVGREDDPLRRAFPEHGALPSVGVLLPFEQSAMLEAR